MSEPDDVIIRELHEFRREMKAGFDRMDQQFSEADKKLEHQEQAMRGDSLLGRYATAAFERRIEAIENRLDRLDKNS